jgi:ATP-binding cassette subfamily B protein
VLAVGGARVATGAIDIGTLVAFLLFVFYLMAPISQVVGAVTQYQAGSAALARIQEALLLPAEDARDAALALDASPAIASDAGIEFQDVVFGYAGMPAGPADPDPLRTDPALPAAILHGVSFTAQRGQRTALVGPSGAGKSTILALIERFYDPESGVVRVGGTDIRALDRHALRAQIGYVEQDAPVLAGSLRDNLKLGAPDATDAQCVEVLHAVNLTEVLDRSDRGLDAPVGEEGVMLSGGERQRLAIARTLLAAPPILLLDESTSNLDGLNEQLLREAIDAVAENRTLLVIAHRLSTVVDSDQIVVLDHGRVVGVGTHSELVASTPLYRDLAKHQLLV